MIELIPRVCFMAAMEKRSSKPAIEAAATHLRAISMEAEDGAFLGSEEALLQTLGFSRSTVRQVARLLEQEGLLRVKRGISGGYYAARPDARTIERVVSSYLESVHFEAEEVTIVASALWVEVIRRASLVRNDTSRALADRFRRRVIAMKPTATFAEVRKVEIESQKAIFTLVESRYIELIFDINIAFASRGFSSPSLGDIGEYHRDFVRRWREAKLLELAAIGEGNVELGLMAARYVRSLWHKRIWIPHPSVSDGPGLPDPAALSE